MNPIGYFSTDRKYKYEQPRQGVFAEDIGIITLNSQQNFEQALDDLIGFERIWIIYLFHQNSNWKPKVLPPRTADNKKKGLFATRSPHRPNSIGMTCAKLLKIDKLKIHITNFDMLDETPVLDIKPYIPYCDSFEKSKAGWVDLKNDKEYTINFAQIALNQMLWIKEKLQLDLINFTKIQLSYEPINTNKKRIQCFNIVTGEYILSCRTWRIYFILKENSIDILKVITGYNENDLKNINDNPYNDKLEHLEFIRQMEM